MIFQNIALEMLLSKSRRPTCALREMHEKRGARNCHA